MGDAELSTLKSAWGTANTWSEWSTLAVVVGVIIDFAVLLFLTRGMSPLEKALLMVANAVIIVGCGGEYVFGHRATLAAEQLQQVSDQKVATLAKVTEDERLARVSLENQIAEAKRPRVIDPNDLIDITEFVRPFAGQQFDFAEAPNCLDCAALIGQIGPALIAAGWEWKDWPSTNHARLPGFPALGIVMGFTGFHVEMLRSDQGNAKLDWAAVRLSAAINVAGVVSEATTLDEKQINADTMPGRIHIFIGPKAP